MEPVSDLVRPSPYLRGGDHVYGVDEPLETNILHGASRYLLQLR